MAFFKRMKESSSKIPDGLWMKCSGCHQTVYTSDVHENQEVCPSCGHHFRMGAMARLDSLVDTDSFEERHAELKTIDPLNFTVGKETYVERVERARKQSGMDEAIITGIATITGTSVALGIMDSSFIMASMGSVLGEKICRLVDDAIEARLPLIIVAASGGARMQEGIFALMQMAKTSEAIRRVNDACIPFISVLTDPTYGGVYASFASLGDIVIAEPEACIGFAGARLIQGALKVKKLPDGFQRAEYQQNNGFVDMIVPRNELRDVLGRMVKYLPPKKVHA